MKKIIIYVVGIIVMLNFISCGGESGITTKKDKSTTHKVLNYLGMPTYQIIALCMDTNEDGECGLSEVQDSRYSVDITDEKLPILLEVEGNIYEEVLTLVFNGFNHKEEKEISILESMIDANAITRTEANPFRTLDTTYSQGNFYFIQANTLERNYHKFIEQGIDKKSAMLRTLQSMGKTIKNNQDKANEINDCRENQRCVLEIIQKLSDELTISDEDALEEYSPTENIVNETEVQNNGKWISPSLSSCETNGGTYYPIPNLCTATWENAKRICSTDGNKLPTIEVLREVVSDCGGKANQNIQDDTSNESYQTCVKNKGFFPSYYWSSSQVTLESFENTAWIMNFYTGISLDREKDNPVYIQCLQ